MGPGRSFCPPANTQKCTHLHKLDLIILATGFCAGDFLKGIEVVGVGRRRLHGDQWAGADGTPGARPQAFKGVTVPGFPNLFLMYGPNTNLGHNSIVFMIECQATYIETIVSGVLEKAARCAEVRAGALKSFVQQTYADLQETAFAGGCTSWYKRSGIIANNWGGSCLSYWLATARVDWSNYIVR
jgi:cation diffusion facilitator CzcD-associated flavoprotein CzcO